jgi:flagellar hook protein FlgE
MGVDGVDVTPRDGITLAFDPSGALEGTGVINMPAIERFPRGVSIDLHSSTQYSDSHSPNFSFSLYKSLHDGYNAGERAAVILDQEGVVTEHFTNGVNLKLGRVII